MKMRRCFTDPHYWKNPALRRSREKNCPSTLTAVTGGDKGAGLENGGGIKLKAFKVPREGEKRKTLDPNQQQEVQHQHRRGSKEEGHPMKKCRVKKEGTESGQPLRLE